MKYCTECGNKYPNELDFCTVDGSKLADRNEAETLRMKREAPPESSSTQRIYERIKVAAGEYFELKTKYRPIRIEVKEITEEVDNRYCARIHVDTEGGLVFGGPGALETTTNEYWLNPDSLIPITKSFKVSLVGGASAPFRINHG